MIERIGNHGEYHIACGSASQTFKRHAHRDEHHAVRSDARDDTAYDSDCHTDQRDFLFAELIGKRPYQHDRRRHRDRPQHSQKRLRHSRCRFGVERRAPKRIIYDLFAKIGHGKIFNGAAELKER